MASHGIVTDKKYDLLLDGRGIGVESVTKWDWLRLSRKDDGPWLPVIFEAWREGGYAVQCTDPNWGDYKYWTVHSKGIYLEKFRECTLWDIEATKNGIVLRSNSGYAAAPESSGKRWLYGTDSEALSHELFFGPSEGDEDVIKAVKAMQVQQEWDKASHDRKCFELTVTPV